MFITAFADLMCLGFFLPAKPATQPMREITAKAEVGAAETPGGEERSQV